MMVPLDQTLQRECDEDPQNHGEQMKKKILERVHWPMRRMNVHDGSCNVGVSAGIAALIRL
jgi:hypothetical protein